MQPSPSLIGFKNPFPVHARVLCFGKCGLSLSSPLILTPGSPNYLI